MLRGMPLRVIAATVAAVTALALTWALNDGGPERARPPLGEVRIEKILDFQLPEV